MKTAAEKHQSYAYWTFFFNNKTPTLNNEHAEKTDIPDRNKPISFIIKFQLSDNEEYNDFIKRYSENSMLTIEYYIDDTNNPELEYYIHHKVFKNDNLNNDKYRTLSATKLADLVDSLGIAKGRNKQENTAIIERYIDNSSSADKKDGKEKVKFKELELLPRLEIYSSENYDDPTSLIKNTLENTYREKFYITTEENKNQTLKPEYLTLKEEIQNDLDEKVNKELKNKLSMHMNGIDSVESVCNIDFSKSLQLNDIIISRNGKRTHVSNLPQGEKNKAQLTIMEWSNDKSASNNVPIIRCYDEPGANLDYMAQKKNLILLKII